MSGLQGESTQSQAEKVTEAKKYLASIKGSLEDMNDTERSFVTRLLTTSERTGNRWFITNKELSWLRDLNAKY